MSRSRQKKEHIDRRGQKPEKVKDPKKSKNRTRVFLRDPVNIFLTTLVILVCFGVMTAMQLLGWLDGVIGWVAATMIGMFAVMCLYDMALLLTDSLAVAEGLVNAGKDEQGNLMIFHIENIDRVELRDRAGNAVPEDRKRYRNVSLTFVMTGGRVNQRRFGRITQKQLDDVHNVLQK